MRCDLLGEHNQISTRETGARPVAALARAFVLAPFYFLLLTLFGLWPWRFGSPFFLVKPLRIPQNAQKTFILRLLAHRMLLRDDRLLRKDTRILLSPYRLKRWLRSPWFTTLRPCAKFTRHEMARTGRSGAAVAVAIYCNALLDSYRYANGTVHRDWFDLERRPDGAFHLPNDCHIRVCCYLLNHKLNPQMPLLQRHYDKSEFHRLCVTHGLPTVPVYAVFDNGMQTYRTAVPDEPLISKAVDLAEGNGVFTRWIPARNSAEDNRLFCGEDGKPHTPEEVFEQLKTQSLQGPYLLQRKIFNHEVIRTLSGTDTLCTLRVPTCRFPGGNIVVLPLAFVRMPTTQDAAVDNLAVGSVGYPVALDTGCLEAGGKHGTVERFSDHPTTGNRVVGVELPYWQESLALCQRAHATAFPTFPTVGWDVAITPDGPLLVEMNIQWLHPSGLPDETFIGKTAYVDCILSHIQHFWPDQMPAPRQGSRGS
jgi:Sugar-transfer associated ATP-grasp